MQQLSALLLKRITGGTTDTTAGYTLKIEYRHSDSVAFSRTPRVGLTDLPEVTLRYSAEPVAVGTVLEDGGVVIACAAN